MMEWLQNNAQIAALALITIPVISVAVAVGLSAILWAVWYTGKNRPQPQQRQSGNNQQNAGASQQTQLGGATASQPTPAAATATSSGLWGYLPSWKTVITVLLLALTLTVAYIGWRWWHGERVLGGILPTRPTPAAGAPLPSTTSIPEIDGVAIVSFITAAIPWIIAAVMLFVFYLVLKRGVKAFSKGDGGWFSKTMLVLTIIVALTFLVLGPERFMRVAGDIGSSVRGLVDTATAPPARYSEVRIAPGGSNVIVQVPPDENIRAVEPAGYMYHWCIWGPRELARLPGVPGSEIIRVREHERAGSVYHAHIVIHDAVRQELRRLGQPLRVEFALTRAGGRNPITC